ncbi:MAG: transporter [Thermoanaerobaculaceae bacterium]
MKPAALLLASLIVAATVRAGPPFVTDDPETPPLHGWEINIPITLERESGEQSLETPLFDLNYGYRENVQLRVEFSLLNVRLDGARTERGLSDTSVGVKWRFLEESQLMPQMAIYPQVTLPTGDHQHRLGDGKPSYGFPLVAQKSWGPWTVFGNVGVIVQSTAGSRDYWYQGLTLVREVSRSLELGVEEYGNSPIDRDERSSLGYNLGGTWKVAESMNVLFSAGRTVRGEQATSVYLGIQLLVGGSGANSK